MTEFLVVDSDASTYCDALHEAFPQFTFHPALQADDAGEAAIASEVLIGLAPYLSDRLVSRMPNLKWVHALTTGVDNLLRSSALGKHVIVTNTHGIHGPQVSELAILLMMSLLRQFPKMIDQQRSGGWERWPQPLLLGRRACLVGLGSIAEALAARCNAFGMHVTGVSDGRRHAEGFERIYRRGDLAEAASQADFLVVIVPYSAETHHIVDNSVLSAMPAGSYVINVARGGCVDEDALLAHLVSGHLGGAGLDVFAVEPLPSESLFRTLPNVIATPHIGGMSDTYCAQALPLVIKHLESFQRSGFGGIVGQVARS
jgi:D-2-hydroxyacid dehydrogenase (NADP+)